jgi:hypothetical protein
VSALDLTPLVSSLDGVLEALDDLSFAQLAGGTAEDPEAVARTQREQKKRKNIQTKK